MKLLEPAQMNATPLSAERSKAWRFVQSLHKASAAKMIRNVETSMLLLDTGTHQFPVSLNSGEAQTDNCYVVSPLATYVAYAKEEIKRLRLPWLEWPLTGMVNGMARLLEPAQLDRLVQVNNWLLSTNLYPHEWQGDDIPELTRLLFETYPDHAISFRSLNHFSNHALISCLQSQGYVAVPSRQVYLFDGTKGERSPMLQRHNTKIDYSLLRRSGYRIVAGHDLSDSDFPRLEELYKLLYLEKYCLLNPQFTADWLRCGQHEGWLEIRVLRTDAGRIDGVLGWFANEQIVSAPVVGYDTTISQRTGLYRMLTRMCLQEAVTRRCLLNFSSGAAQFKRLRGGQAAIEYSLVYIRHLPGSRRLVWRLLSLVLQTLAVPIMRTLKL